MNRKRNILILALISVVTISSRDVKADFVFSEPENLGPGINTSIWDWYPRISADGLSLYFLQMVGTNRNAEVWVASRATKHDPWDTAVNLEWSDMATTYDSVKVLPGLTTADGLEFYFGAAWLEGYGDSDIFVMMREKIDDAWGDPVNLGPIVNSPATEMMPAISPDGLELYFSGHTSELARPGGHGGADLWVTKRATRADPWTEPVNLGPTINSAYQDARPHISADGLLLLFDSQRPGGYGQGDLYVSKRATLSDPWGEPMNLGSMVNTSAFEEVACISPDGSTLYYDCDRSGGHGGFDLWQVSIEPVVDLNSDGIVDAWDMWIMIDYWGTDEPLCDIGPTPFGDGIVDVQDLIVLAEHLFEETMPVE